MGRPDDRSNARIPAGALLVGAAVSIAITLVVGLIVSWTAAILPAVLAAVLCVVALRALPRSASAPGVDAFAVGEPWRQFVQRSLRSERELARIVDATPSGPLRDRLEPIADRLAKGVQETWRIAQHGDSLDAAVSRLDPVALRARFDHTRDQATVDMAVDMATDAKVENPAIDAIQRQLDTVERIQQQSSRTASSLQLTQLRVEELVARAAEVSVGSADTEAYAHDVDDLVIELEALRLAIDETDHL